MKKTRFKTRLSKRQRRKNLLVVLLVLVFSYIFTLLFSFAIGIFDNWSQFEVYMLGLAMTFFVLSMLLFPLLIVALVLGWQKGRAKRVQDDSTFIAAQNLEYYRDALDGLSPSSVSLLVDLDIYGKKDIAATLLQMNNKKLLEFGEDGKIVPTRTGGQPLESGEAELLNLVQSGQLNSKKALAWWKTNRFREAERLGYIQKCPVDKDRILGLFALAAVLSVLAAIFLNGAFLGSRLYEIRTIPDAIKTIAALLGIDVLVFVPTFLFARKAGYLRRGDVLWERTPLGNEMAEKIAGLSRYISEFSLLSEAKKEAVVLWDDYLVYAIVLEENDAIVRDISKQYQFNLRRLGRLWG